MKAYCLIKSEPHYRREAFVAGLARRGYDVRVGYPNQIAPGEVLVIWNRYAEMHELATRFERAGGVVLVAENAYLGMDRTDRRRYALARGAHNGAGTWPAGTANRFASLGIAVQPWREEGEHILVCPNRSFGMPGMIMPPDWATDVVRRLKKVTARPIKVRPHPGNALPKVPLADDLRNAWAVVIWSSSVGCEALVAGVPVCCEAPRWICKAATGGVQDVDRAGPVNREAALHSLAWAQWHVDEIGAGLPFEYLLDRA